MSGGGGFFSPGNLLGIGATLVAPEFAPAWFGPGADFGTRLLANAALGGGISALTGGDMMTGALSGGLSSALRSPEILEKLGIKGTPASIGANTAGAMKGPSVAGGDGIGSLVSQDPKAYSLTQWPWSNAPTAGGFDPNTIPVTPESRFTPIDTTGAPNFTQGVPPVQQPIQNVPAQPTPQMDYNPVTGEPIRNLSNSAYNLGTTPPPVEESFFQKYKWPIIGGVALAGASMMQPKTKFPEIIQPNVPQFGLAANYQRTGTPTPVYPGRGYAEGGIAALASGGNMGNQPANVDFMGGDMYPMSQQQRSFYATPTQMPTSAQQALASYEPKTNPLTGQPTAHMADGGVTKPLSQLSQDISPENRDKLLAQTSYNPMLNAVFKGLTTNQLAQPGVLPVNGGISSNYQPTILDQNTWNNLGYAKGLATANIPLQVAGTPGQTEATPGMADGGIAALQQQEATKRWTSELPHIVPTASAKGGMLKGPGDGMSDSIPGTIAGGGQIRPARLADGEFVIPADVVSHLGNGSTDAGAKQLYAMMDKVRKARTGRKSQGKQINPGKYMPA